MTKVIEILDRIKSDRRLKNQIIRACLIFTIALVVVISLVLTSEKEPQQEVVTKEDEKLDLIPAENTQMEDKSTVFKKMEWEEMKDEEELEVVNNSSSVFDLADTNTPTTSISINNTTSTEETANTSIDNYIAQRRRAREQQQNSSYTNAYSQTTRSYNPYGNRNDWEDRQVNEEQQYYQTASQTQNYVTAREQQGKQSSFSASKNKKDEWESLSEAQKRRIILTTGQAQYKESEQISAMIVSSGMVKSGETITLALKEDAILSFEKIPKGTTIAGKVSFSDNRLNVQFSTMRLKNKIIKIDLVLYGLDGLEGLPINSDIMVREIEDTGIDEAMSGVTAEGKINPITIMEKTLKSSRRKQEAKVDLGRDIMCILVNRKTMNNY